MEEEKLKRCFIALEIPREAIAVIEEKQELILKKKLFSGKFTEGENLHLTLKFLGEISEKKIEEVRKKLKEIKFSRFEVSFGELGVFINSFNSILWLKINGQGIWDLQKQIEESLVGLFDKEERFMSHITLARMKKIYGKEEFLNYIKNMKIEKLKFVVKDFVLKSSVLDRAGPVYGEIEKFDLDKRDL